MTIPNVVVSAPSQLFTLPSSFAAIAGGSIYIGQINTDPTVAANQIQVYVQNDDGSTNAVSQPISIGAGGYPEHNGAVAKFVTVEGQSMAVLDANGVQQFYYPDVLKYDPEQLRYDLGLSNGSSLVGTLGNGPFVALSYYKNIGLTDDDAMQTAFDSNKSIIIDSDITLTKNVNFDIYNPVSISYVNNSIVTGLQYLPQTLTNPDHVLSSNTIRKSLTQEANKSQQGMIVETLCDGIHDNADGTLYNKNFVSGFFGITSRNSLRQRMWAVNTLTNAHSQFNTGDEAYGIEIDMNIDTNAATDGGGQYVGLYIAGIGDVSNISNSDGIRIQRLRDGQYKWNNGLRIFDSNNGVVISGAETYSFLSVSDAPMHLRPITQNGQNIFSIGTTASNLLARITDFGYAFFSRLFIGTNRVNIDGGMKFYSTINAVSWGAIAVNGYVDKDVTTLFGINVTDWTNVNFTVTPTGYANSMAQVNIQTYINSSKTQAYVRVLNISGQNLSAVNVGLHAVLMSHSPTN
ncbi:phage tailspike protein [Sodalis sp. RH16]|uniref:phage tailspike protein n=1 Tax=Sodalis sp. RH16 TaxID=3394331 RepID=UPI0039B68642